MQKCTHFDSLKNVWKGLQTSTVPAAMFYRMPRSHTWSGLSCAMFTTFIKMQTAPARGGRHSSNESDRTINVSPRAKISAINLFACYAQSLSSVSHTHSHNYTLVLFLCNRTKHDRESGNDNCFVSRSWCEQDGFCKGSRAALCVFAGSY